MILENPQESRKEWLKMIFEYQAKIQYAGWWTCNLDRTTNHAIRLFRVDMIESRMTYIIEKSGKSWDVSKKEEDFLYSGQENYSD